MSRLDDLRSVAVSYEGTREEYPFGAETTVFKTPKGKMFILATEEAGDVIRMSLKLTPEESAEARMLPFITPALYLARHGWVSVRVTNDFEWETALGFIARSPS